MDILEQINQENTGRKRLRNQHRNIKLMSFQPSRKKATNLYLSPEASRKLSEDCGFKAAFLHSRYVDMAEETNQELTDGFMATIVGWSERTVADWRRKLEKSFWFRKETIQTANGKLGATFYLLDQVIISEFIEDTEYEYFEDFIKNKKYVGNI